MFVLLSTSFCLILSIIVSVYLTVVFSLYLSPKSSVQAAISGHPVTMATLATLGHGAAGAHSGMSLFLCYPSPSICLVSCSLSRFFLFPKFRNDNFTLFLHTSPCGLLYPSLFLSLFCLLYVSRCLSLCLSRDSLAAGWWKVGSPASHAERLVAKHIKAVRRHICQSQMMIRVPSLSEETEFSFVMQDIPPYLCVYILHQTLVRQRSQSLRF